MKTIKIPHLYLGHRFNVLRAKTQNFKWLRDHILEWLLATLVVAMGIAGYVGATYCKQVYSEHEVLLQENEELVSIINRKGQTCEQLLSDPKIQRIMKVPPFKQLKN